MKLHTTTTIIREYEDSETGNVLGEEEIEIRATYLFGTPATHLDPEEHPEVEILSATIDGEEVELTEAEEAYIKTKILEDPPEPDYDEE